MLFFTHISAALLSGSLLGLIARRVLAAEGLVAGFGPGLLLAGMVAAAWCLLQQIWMAAVWLLKPSRSRLPLVFDTLSNLSVLVVVPWLMGYSIPLPWRSVQKYEILLLLAAFGGLHVFFKLMTFYAALYVYPGGRTRFLGHLGATVLCLVVALFCWRGLTEGKWEIGWEPAPPSADYEVGGMTSRAAALREGVAYKLPISEKINAGMMAVVWLGCEQGNHEKTIQVAYQFLDVLDRPTGALITREMQVDSAIWRSFSIPVTQATANAASVRFSWTSKVLPDWVMALGLRPASGGSETILAAGPHAVAAPTGRAADTVVVVALDGLRADDMAVFGGRTDAMPKLSERARRGQIWDRFYTTAPEPAGAWISLLTGRSPLTHGYLGGHEGDATLPTWATQMREKGYVTAIYTAAKGLGIDPLENNPLAVKGMLFVNHQCPAEQVVDSGGAAPPRMVPGSVAETLEHAAVWMEENRDKAVFLVIRLRESDHPVWLPRHNPGSMPRSGRLSADQQRYDVMRHIDEKLDIFFNRLSEMLGERAVYCVLSPFSLDIRRDPMKSPEQGLRIPGFCWGSSVSGGRVSVPGTLCDVFPTVMALAGLDFPEYPEGGVLHRMGDGRVSASVWGNPLQLSLRYGGFRLTLDTGIRPFSGTAPAEMRPVSFEQISEDGSAKQVSATAGPYQTVLQNLLNTGRNFLNAETPALQ